MIMDEHTGFLIFTGDVIAKVPINPLPLAGEG